MTQQAFKTWWYNEGSQAPYTHHDCEEHTMRMCEIAWNKAQALVQPEQEPVAHCKVRPLRGDESFPKVEIDWVNQPIPGPLYTQPPQRTWVGLTDEEVRAVIRAGEYDSMEEFARAIEAAHGIKENS